MTAVVEGFRLSPQQRRVWSLSDRGMRPWARAWCVLMLEGELSTESLRRAIERVVARQEILRTTFQRRSGSSPFQVVAEDVEAAWRLTEGLETPGADPHPHLHPLAAAQELVRQEAATPFDVARGPLLRLRLSRLSSSRHLLLFTVPALCADRKGLYSIARQLAAEYAGDAPGRDREGTIQYADFSEWQNELLESDDEPARTARTHWSGRFLATGALPFDGMEDVPGGMGRSELDLNGELLAAIEAHCRAEGFSPGDFLLTCWQALLWRTTGETEVLVRDVHDGRKLDDLKEAVGLFARALPLGASFEGNPSFDEAARRTAQARAQNEEWQEYFGKKEDFEAVSAGRNRSPVFEFFQRPRLPDSGGVSFRILADFARVDDAPLWLDCASESDRVRISCSVDPEILPSRTGDRLLAHLEPLIAAAAKNPRARTGELPILTARERRRILIDWNQTAAPFPRSRCIHELIEERVSRGPDAAALVFGGERLTYGELNDRANELAWRLIERGVDRGARVGVALVRSADGIVALLAILKSGGAYVPLNPQHPAARLTLQLAQSGSRIVITEAKWLEKFAEFSGETICLDREQDRPAPRKTRNPERRAEPADLAYVMYTSGSTGIPKGVGVRHESLVNYAHFVVRDLLGIDPIVDHPLTFATVSTISADLGNTSIFPSLLSGGCLHVVGYETAIEGNRFAEYVSENPIDVLKIVPSHLAALLSSGGGRDMLPGRFLILGGEALTWDLVDRITRLGGSCQIINHYGPTETTVGSLVLRLRPGQTSGPSRTVPIGRPIANTQIYVLDAANEPVPVGVPGELFIGGVGLAEGYCNHPAETAARFVRHPHSEEPEARLYRTGDRGRFLADGSLEFLGRCDDQVKIRGFRIEPGEVRAVIAAHPAVSETFVLAREDSPAEPRLVAYVVAGRNADLSSEELRDWARERLPDYMVPSAFVPMKALPLTANGKIDRRALPSPEEARPERAYTAPRTPVEGAVAAIWSEVLRIERVGRDDNFFDLGGNSLLVTQAVWRMRRTFERELPIRWLFEFPTVAQLAARIQEAQQEEISHILDDLERLPDEKAARSGERS